MSTAGVALALLIALLAASCCAGGRDIVVDGNAGWAPNSKESFNHWAERNSFYVNDTLVFRYNKDADAVLWVSQSHYDTCDTSKPLRRLEGGDSRFLLQDSGAYFFISANAKRCELHERLIVVVRAVANSTAPPPKSPSTSGPPPLAAASAPCQSPTLPPSSSENNASSPSPSSAVALRGGAVLACLITVGAAVLV